MHSFDFEHRGRTLRGVLHLPQSSPSPAVVLCHGFSGTRVEFGYMFVRLAKRLAERGIAAYRFDFAGCGDSDGDFADLAVSDQADQALAALDALGRHSGIDPDRLSLMGMSLGGLAASLAAAARPVRSLTLWAPAAVAVDRAVLQHRRTAIAEHGYDELYGMPVYERFVDDAEAIDAFEGAAGHTGPVLLAGGSIDDILHPAILDGYRRIYGDRLEQHVLDGVGHGFETVAAREHLLELTEAFMRRHA
ncbi:alpha/beta hydrolase family protein [Glycomyces arizonensis]|uniref:alpha/beta hydrolase family protein n=1 Tax=Glycomyces arizonensis TaxID=256035 RepID=UPI00041616B6|nr:alpha/beta fold hydrolase [Glycomyces arizonensis]